MYNCEHPYEKGHYHTTDGHSGFGIPQSLEIALLNDTSDSFISVSVLKLRHFKVEHLGSYVLKRTLI